MIRENFKYSPMKEYDPEDDTQKAFMKSNFSVPMINLASTLFGVLMAST